MVLRREWLGLSLALLFALLAQLALCGFLLLPGVIPQGMAVLSAVVAATVWLAAQWLGVVRARAVLGNEAQHAVEVLRDRAAEAMKQRRFAEARKLLQVAFAINDEDFAVYLLWARLMTLTGQFHEARKAWESVLRLDKSGNHREEAITALDNLPE